MIDVQFPSIRPEGAMRMARSMEATGLFDAGATLSIAYDPRTFDDHHLEVMRGQFKARMVPQPRYEGIPPMFNLRTCLHKGLKPQQPWLLTDDDDAFGEGSLQYLKDCLGIMNKMREATGRLFFLGTAGHFGSNGPQDRPHFSPRNALMPKGHGILFPKEIDLGTADLPVPGGLEEHLICAYATVVYDALPLKRFRSPMKVKVRRADDRATSDIHDYDVWSANAMHHIGLLAGDTSWAYPRAMGDKGTNAPKAFVRRVQQAEKQYNHTLNELWKSKELWA